MKIINSNFHFGANKISKKQAQHIDNIVQKSSKIDIICHETTDRDSANSALAMADYIEQQGKNARIILSQDIKSLTLRTQNKNILQANKLNKDEKPDLIFCVDFSQKNRVSKNVYDYIQKANKIVGFDHHFGCDVVDSDVVQINKSNEKPINKIASFYIDTSAKSATSIVYRFYEAMNKEITPDVAYKLFFGLVSDCSKKGLVVCDGNKGVIKVNKEMSQDKNAYEIYENLSKKLTSDEIKYIAKKIDIMSSLSKDEKVFSDSLYDRVKYNDNNTIAYVEISPNDEAWNKLGCDNSTTSTILNRFRQTFLKKYDNVKAVFVFYKAHNAYRMSVHSKENNLKQFYDYAQKNIKNIDFAIGGHNDRGGGKINTTDEAICRNWAESIISVASDYYNY